MNSLKHCEDLGCEFALSNVWAKGGEGGQELADKVLKTLENKKSDFKPLYEDELPLEDKILKIAKEIYGADGVTYDAKAKKSLIILHRWDLAASQYVWLRHSIHFLMMRLSLEDQKALLSI